MRCPECGGYSFDSDDRCLNCGHTISFKPKPPPWWGTKDWFKPTRELPSEKETSNLPSTKVIICPRCNERSLFYNKKDGLYECLNKKCKAKGKSLDDISRKSQAPVQQVPKAEVSPAPVSRKPPVTKTPKKGIEKLKKPTGVSIPNWIKVGALSIFPLLIIALIIYFNWGGIASPIPAITPPVGSSDSTPITTITISENFSSEETEGIVFNLINNAREKAGVHTLERREYLDTLAREHSEHIALTDKYGYSENNLRENIYWHIATYHEETRVAESVVKRWMERSRGRENLLTAEIDTCGIGVFKEEVSVYITYLAD